MGAAKRGLRWGLWLPTAALERHYWGVHSAHCALQDAVFFGVHLTMHAMMLLSDVLPARLRPTFLLGGVVVPGGALLVQRCAGGALYRRYRGALVFGAHLALTHVRAAVVYAMKSEAAVGVKGAGTLGVGESPGHLMLRMLMVSGVLFRVLETLGLQIPVTQAAVISAVYLVDHGICGWAGMRLASANSAFLAFHGLHDAVDAALGLALQVFAPVRAARDTCAACPGLVLWLWMCLAGGVALPLYLLVRAERAGKLQWLARMQEREEREAAAAAAAAAAAGSHTGGGGGFRALAELAAPAAAAGTATARLHGGSGGAGRGGPVGPDGAERAARPPPPAAPPQGDELAAAWEAAVAAQASQPGWLISPAWLAQLALVFGLTVLCWLAANVGALALAPRLLSREAYHLQCPGRMPTPFVDSALVHG